MRSGEWLAAVSLCLACLCAAADAADHGSSARPGLLHPSGKHQWQARGRGWEFGAELLSQTDETGYSTATIGGDQWHVEEVSLTFRAMPGSFLAHNCVYVKARGVAVNFQTGGGGSVASAQSVPPPSYYRSGVLSERVRIDPGKWYRTCIRFAGQSARVFLEGEEVLVVGGPLTHAGPVSLSTWKTAAQFKDVTVRGVNPPPPTPQACNYQPNSSFEYATNPDMPDCWREKEAEGGLAAEWTTDRGYETFHQKWRLDETTARHGKRSLRLRAPLALCGVPATVPTGTPIVASAYLRAEQDGVPAVLGLTHLEMRKPLLTREVTLTSQWQRCSVAVDRLERSGLRFFVIPKGEGSVWVDAVQLEKGQTPAAYAPSPLDEGFRAPFFPPQAPPVRTAPPTLTIGSCGVRKPEIDGRLDDPCWQDAAQDRLVHYYGQAPAQQTQFSMTCDSRFLYLAVQCFDPDVGNLVVQPVARDSGWIFSQDSLELFIDPTGAQDVYYQLAFNSLGNRFDTRLGGEEGFALTWDGDWEVKCRKEADKWCAEVALPLSMFVAGGRTSDFRCIRLNVARNCPRGPHRYLSWAPVRIGFREPERFGTVVCGQETARLFSARIEGMSLRPTSPAERTYALTVLVRNDAQQAAAALRLDSKVSEPYAEPFFGHEQVAIAPNAAASVSIPGLRIKGKRCKVELKLRDSETGTLLSMLNRSVDVPAPLDAFTEYSYYTGEAAIRLFVDVHLAPELLGGKSCPRTHAHGTGMDGLHLHGPLNHGVPVLHRPPAEPDAVETHVRDQPGDSGVDPRVGLPGHAPHGRARGRRDREMHRARREARRGPPLRHCREPDDETRESLLRDRGASSRGQSPSALRGQVRAPGRRGCVRRRLRAPPAACVPAGSRGARGAAMRLRQGSQAGWASTGLT